MRKTVGAISRCLDKVYIVLASIFLTILIVSSGLQVFTRYVLNNSQSWTEEMSRYAFIYFTMLGTAIATGSRGHAKMDFLVGLFKGKAKRIHAIIVDIAVLLCGALFIIYGCMMVSATMRSFSPSMHFPMGLAYLSVPLGGLGVFVHSLNLLLEQFAPKSDPTSGNTKSANPISVQ